MLNCTVTQTICLNSSGFDNYRKFTHQFVAIKHLFLSGWFEILVLMAEMRTMHASIFLSPVDATLLSMARALASNF